MKTIYKVEAVLFLLLILCLVWTEESEAQKLVGRIIVSYGLIWVFIEIFKLINDQAEDSSSTRGIPSMANIPPPPPRKTKKDKSMEDLKNWSGPTEVNPNDYYDVEYQAWRKMYEQGKSTLGAEPEGNVFNQAITDIEDLDQMYRVPVGNNDPRPKLDIENPFKGPSGNILVDLERLEGLKTFANESKSNVRPTPPKSKIIIEGVKPVFFNHEKKE